MNWGWFRWPAVGVWSFEGSAVLVDGVWREEEEVDAHNAQAWELIVLCRALRCVWDSAHSDTGSPFEKWEAENGKHFLLPSSEWPFGNLAEKVK